MPAPWYHVALACGIAKQDTREALIEKWHSIMRTMNHGNFELAGTRRRLVFHGS